MATNAPNQRSIKTIREISLQHKGRCYVAYWFVLLLIWNPGKVMYGQIVKDLKFLTDSLILTF